MKELHEKLIILIAEFVKDLTLEVENGNKAAGLRARKISVVLKKTMSRYRRLSLEESRKI